MASFAYEVVDKTGKVKKGSMEAVSEERVRAQLKTEGNIILSVTEQNALTKDISIDIGGKPTARDFSVFCRQFVSMTRAGVSLLEALEMLGEQTENKKLNKAIRAVKASVEKGESLTASMREQKKIFPSLLCSMVEAGEASGSIDVSLDRMAVHFEKDAKIKSLVKKAAIYPINVGIVAIVVIIVMLTMVIPNFTSMFADMDTEMPAITVAVVKASDFVKAKWYILVIIVVAAVFLLKWFRSTKAGEYFFAKLGLKIPMLASLTVKSSSARFARTASTLLAAGMPLVEVVEITANVMDNRLIADALRNCKEEIIQGMPLSVPLEKSKLFPPMVYHMTKIGEETGDLESLLEKLADYYEEEVEMATQSLMAALEPLIIVILAAIVIVMIGACMAPMLSMYQGLDNL